MTNSEQADKRVAELIEELRHEREPYYSYTCQEIVDQLKAIGEPALQALAHALNDEDVKMREATVYALGQIGEPALEALTCALDNADADVRRQAVDKLGDIGEPALEALGAL